jgi:hypothetical protein
LGGWLIHAPSVILRVYDKIARKIIVYMDVGTDPAWYSRNKDRYASLNPFFKVQAAPGEMVFREQFFSDQELVKTELYNDFIS